MYNKNNITLSELLYLFNSNIVIGKINHYYSNDVGEFAKSDTLLTDINISAVDKIIIDQFGDDADAVIDNLMTALQLVFLPFDSYSDIELNLPFVYTSLVKICWFITEWGENYMIDTIKGVDCNG